METVISGRSRLLAVIGMGLFGLLAITKSFAGEETIFLKEGKQLYAQNCSRCHGDVDNSAKTGRSMNRIRTALRTQPQHRPVSSLNDEQILLIAIALKEGEE
jgi:mono/diheme cytochrome c family protein